MRKYKRKRPAQWRDKDKRMMAAVRLRSEGKSLREIGRELAVGHQTVIRDLRRWNEIGGANVVQLRGPSCPPRGEMDHPNGPPKAPVSMIGRRMA